MRFLVTGATGFIGAHVVQSLLDRYHEVVAISKSNCLTGQKNDRLSFIQADLLDSTDVQRAVRESRSDVLVHCAWDTTPGLYWTSLENLAWTAASLNLFRAFRSSRGKRIVVVGTSAEYCWRDCGNLVENHTPLNPTSLYGTCKNSLRQILESWATTENFSWAWGRVFCPFGPAEKPVRLIPKLIRRLMTEEKVEFDSGKLIRDFLHVADVGDAFAALAESTLTGPVNVASGMDLSIRELVIKLASHLGMQEKLQFNKRCDPTGEPPRIVADIAKLREEIGWRPKLNLDERLAETADWWRSKIASAR
jgi:nucleoside-diphosphate-sugar epimerase